jgi:hypothetical protein
MRSDFCFKSFSSLLRLGWGLIFVSSYFQVSRGLDKSFSSLSRLGWGLIFVSSHFQVSQDLDEVWFLFQVIFKTLEAWMRSGFCFKSFSSLSRLGWSLTSCFWFSAFERIQETWGKDLTKNVKSSQDLDELVLLFNCHFRESVWSTLIGRNEPKRSISSLSRLGWGLGIPIGETLLVILGARSMRFRKTGIYCQKSREARADSHSCQATAKNRRFCCLVLV